MNRYKDWLEEAAIDAQKAQVDLQHGYYNWCCFTSQQAAEKAVKALSMFLGFDVWGHSIVGILKIIKEKIEIPEIILEKAQLLDTFYIPTRYPNGFSMGKPSDYYNRRMAQDSINACDEIIKFCKSSISG